MLWVYIHYTYFNYFSAGTYTSKSDVYRRQILTYKDRPRTERIKKVSIALVPEPDTDLDGDCSGLFAESFSMLR